MNIIIPIILYACLHTTVGKLFRIDDFPRGQIETSHAVTVCINSFLSLHTCVRVIEYHVCMMHGLCIYIYMSIVRRYITIYRIVQGLAMDGALTHSLISVLIA